MKLPALAFLIGFGTTVASAVDITTCGVFLPPGGVGTLTQDLACGPSTYGVFLNHGATLRLNGHVLAFGPVLGLAAVGCLDSCYVLGPGEITGRGTAIAGGHGRIQVTGGVDIHGAGVGIVAPSGRSTIVAIDVTVRDGTALALRAQSVRSVNVNPTNNGGFGDDASRVRVTDSTITGNAGIGIVALRARLRDSTVTGNDGSGAGIDIDTAKRPRLFDSTCGRSQVDQQPIGTT